MLLVGSVLVPALLFLVAALQNRAILFDEAGRRTVKTAAVLEQHAASTMQIYEMVFSRVEDFLRLHPGPFNARELYPFLAQLDEDARQVDAIFLMDENGRVIAHSRFPPPLDIVAGDRDYFIAVKEQHARIFIGVPVSGRLSGQRRLNIGYRLQSPDGHFIGAIGISVSEDYFADFYATVGEDAATVMSLIRADGTPLVRTPPLPSGVTDGTDPGFATEAQQARGQAVRLVSPVDGVDRLYAYRKIGEYPVYVSYGLDVAGILRHWHQNLFDYAVIAGAAGLLLLLAVWTALTWARQEEEATRQLRAEIAQRTAAETRRDEAEAALRQAQKMEAVGQMTGGVAHDFNNLLTVVIGNLDLATSAGAMTEEVRQQLVTALKAAERGGTLTQQLLAFARRQMLSPEIVNPNRLIEDFAQLIRQAAGAAVQISMNLSPTLDPCCIDRSQFEAAILNLVVNARDAMDNSGSITIETSNVEIPIERDERALELQPGPHVLIAVSDTGKGMSPSVLEKAFEPFFTTKEVGRGSGLGLSMVYGFVKQSGGHVSIESWIGEGTTVRIYLPRSIQAQADSAIGAREGDAAPGGSESILVVDDNRDVLEVTTDILRRLGYGIMTARDSNEALSILKTGRPIDAIFTDIVMPGGMAGTQLAEAAIELRPELKVLLTTGYAAKVGRNGSTLDGRFPVLTKPYRRSELAFKLREVLQNAPTERIGLD